MNEGVKVEKPKEKIILKSENMKKIVLSLSLFLFSLIATHGQTVTRQQATQTAQQRYVQKVDSVVTLTKQQKSALIKALTERNSALEPLRDKRDKESVRQKIAIMKSYRVKEQEILNVQQKAAWENALLLQRETIEQSVSQKRAATALPETK
jgi:uncharacterized lipoprotein YajG